MCGISCMKERQRERIGFIARYFDYTKGMNEKKWMNGGKKKSRLIKISDIFHCLPWWLLLWLGTAVSKNRAQIESAALAGTLSRVSTRWDRRARLSQSNSKVSSPEIWLILTLCDFSFSYSHSSFDFSGIKKQLYNCVASIIIWQILWNKKIKIIKKSINLHRRKHNTGYDNKQWYR